MCPSLPSISKDQITSSTVTGVPSENRASFRKVNSTHDRSGGVSTDSAKSPYSVKGSFSDWLSRLSYPRKRHCHGGVPFMTKGLRESNPPVLPKTMRPPLGASGLA